MRKVKDKFNQIGIIFTDKELENLILKYAKSKVNQYFHGCNCCTSISELIKAKYSKSHQKHFWNEDREQFQKCVNNLIKTGKLEYDYSGCDGLTLKGSKK